MNYHCNVSAHYTHLHKRMSAEVKAYLSTVQFYSSTYLLVLLCLSYFCEDITYIHILYTLYLLYLTSNVMFVITVLQ